MNIEILPCIFGHMSINNLVVGLSKSTLWLSYALYLEIAVFENSVNKVYKSKVTDFKYLTKKQ